MPKLMIGRRGNGGPISGGFKWIFGPTVKMISPTNADAILNTNTNPM